MAKKQDGSKPKFSSLSEAGLESFETRELSRADIKNADYNPRKMTDGEREKLKAALRKHGLVAPITWNVRTGNIVGGHQRMSIMDSLMGSKDYKLTVAAIDVDEAREKELNILLNNAAAQGSFDLASLKELFEDSSVTLEGAGFDMTDMINMFGDGVFNEGERDEDLARLAEKLAEVSAAYSAIQNRNKRKTEEEFYLVFVFAKGPDADAVIAEIGGTANRYQNGAQLMRKLGVVSQETDQ